MFREGRRLGCGSLDVFLGPAGDGRSPRIGIVVPRHGRTIVERNRLRRRLGEIVRTRWLPAEREQPRPRDLLIRARAEAYRLDFDGLAEELRGCLDLAAC